MVVPKTSNVKVRILETKKFGILCGSQNDFFGNLWYFVRVKGEVLPYKITEFRYIEPRVKK